MKGTQDERKPKLTTQDYFDIDRKGKQKDKERIAEAKVWLARANTIDLQIASKEQLIKHYENLANKCTSNPSQVLGDQTSSGATRQGGRVERYGLLIVDTLAEIEKEQERLAGVIFEIEEVVSMVTDDILRVLLEQRFILRKKWAEVADFIRYSERHCKYLINKASLSVYWIIEPKLARNITR